MNDFIDISLPIIEGMPVYPGTAETKITRVKSGSGTSVLSEISLTSHAGTHIDAPSHSVENAKDIDELPLQTFYGPCRVLDMTACQGVVDVADLQTANIQPNERVLLKTNNSLRGFETFYPDFVYLSPEAAQFLADMQVALVGIDSLSIKQRGAADNTSHTALLEKNIPILEGLDLSKAAAGEYTLCALPLGFKGIDGSPTRAVLIK